MAAISNTIFTLAAPRHARRRLRIISGYTKIQQGDEKTLAIYATSICHTADMSEITVDNLMIRLDMLTMGE